MPAPADRVKPGLYIWETAMAAYIVTYDLHKQGQNYSCITKKLEEYGYYCHLQGSVWVIVTSQNCVQIRDNLMQCLDANDKLFVGQLAGEAAWTGYTNNISDWLKGALS